MVDQVRSDIALLYRRAGFGLRPHELDALAPGGYDAAVDLLVAGLGAPDPAGDLVPVPAFTPYSRPDAAKGSPEARAALKQRSKALRGELAALQDWWLGRMIATATPLREKLTLFWHGHFATGVAKVKDAKLMYLQNQTFRQLGGGSFNALTQAVAKDGAMMIWLDTVTDKKGRANENFGREMMELFTLGAGNYSQDDVTAASRGFTGWTYDRPEYRYRFQPRQHDDGRKTYLGQTGNWNGDDIVNIATNDPMSGPFVLAKLWSHFAYPVTPSDSVIKDLLPSYGHSASISAALAALLRHPAFRSAATRTSLVKQPIEYVVSAARALGVPATAPGSPAPSLAAMATSLGQTPFDPPNVGGWGQNSYWLDTATAQNRLRTAIALASRADLQAVEAMPAAQRVDTVAALLGLDAWGATTAGALQRVSGDPVQLVALALTSPEFVLA